MGDAEDLKALVLEAGIDDSAGAFLLGLDTSAYRRLVAGSEPPKHRIAVFIRLLRVALQRVPKVFDRLREPSLSAHDFLAELRQVKPDLVIEEFAALMGRSTVSVHRWLSTNGDMDNTLGAKRLVGFIRHALAAAPTSARPALLKAMVEVAVADDHRQFSRFAEELREVDPQLDDAGIAALFGRSEFTVRRWRRPGSVPVSVIERMHEITGQLRTKKTAAGKRAVLRSMMVAKVGET